MLSDPQELRRQVIRRVRYATNVIALERDMLPPEGPLDVAMTNGLLAIVAYEDSSAIWDRRARLLAARALIAVAQDKGVLDDLQADELRAALDVTQPMRHGRADDEWIAPSQSHLRAVKDLDEHPALAILNKARNELRVDQLLVDCFREAAEDYLWEESPDPKSRSMVPDPEYCDECSRHTLIIRSWDDFGGTMSPGFCLACGYERSEEVAYDQVVSDAINRAVKRSD